MKSVKLYVNVIPIIIILLLIGGAGYFLFGQDLEITIEDRKTQVTRVEGVPVMLYVSEDREKVRKVIKSDEELNDFLNEVDKKGELTIDTSVNFNKHYLLGTATKTLEGENHEFKIKKIYKDTDDKRLTVVQERVDPDESCELEGGRNIWVDIVQINKTDWNIDFELVKKILPCENASEE